MNGKAKPFKLFLNKEDIVIDDGLPFVKLMLYLTYHLKWEEKKNNFKIHNICGSSRYD